MMGVLGDYLEILGGGTPSRDVEAYWNGDLPWATVKDLTTKRLSETYESITKRGADECATNIVPENTLLISTRMALGRMSITDVPMAFNQDLKALRITGPIDQDYLFHFLSSKEAYFISRGNGATVKGFKVDDIRSIPFDPPPLPTQRRIAAVLDKAQALVANDRQTLALYDQLAKSLFLEMFGDPVWNERGWEVVKLKTCYADSEATRCGPFGSALKKGEYVDEGVPVWTMDNIIGHTFDPGPCLFITPQKFEDLRHYAVKDGDIIISRAGTVGKMCVLRSGYEHSIISTNLIKLSLDKSRLHPEVFARLMTYFRGRVSNLRTGKEGAFTHMNTQVLDNLEIALPPIEIQEEYLNVVGVIGSQRAQAEQSLRQSEGLFGSLLQEAFSGGI